MMVFKFHHNGMGTKLGWLRSKNDYRKMVHQSAISCQTWWECSGHGLAILSRDHSTSMCLPACISVMSKKKKKKRCKLLNFSLGGSASDSSHTIFLWSPLRTAHEQWCGQRMVRSKINRSVHQPASKVAVLLSEAFDKSVFLCLLYNVYNAVFNT